MTELERQLTAALETLSPQYEMGVSFDVAALPAFCRYEGPLEYGAGRKVTHKWAGGEVSMSMLHDFCEALSSGSNHCIRRVDV